MKLTGIEIENVFEGLQTLQNYKFDINTGCSIAKLINQLQPKYLILMNKKDEMIKKYGKKDDKGKVILNEKNMAQIQTEYIEIVQEELKKVYEAVYDIDARYLKMEDLKGTELPLKQISNLLPILE